MEHETKTTSLIPSPVSVTHPPPTTNPIAPVFKPTTPPPLMSLKSFPDLDSTSPPRKARKRDMKNFTDRYSFENVFKEREQNWQRFFVMSRKDGNFSLISPFLYCTQIIQAIGKPKSVQKTASGSLNIEAVSVAQAQLLLQMKRLGDDEISVEPNKRLNTSKGVVVCRDFMICSEEEIKTGMADLGVIDVRRVNRRQGGTLVATASLILTFNTPEPPEQIEAAYYKLKVRKYIPSPLRCFKCLKFGHTSVRCRSAGQVCACGLYVHENAPCQDPPVCVNCAELHSSRSPDCNVFKEEKEIQRIKTLQNVPYSEAKQLVRSSSYVKPEMSYASAAKTKNVIVKKDWQKILQPFVFTGNQGPSKPVWAAQSAVKPEKTYSPKANSIVVGVCNPPSLGDQGEPLAPLPTPSSTVVAAGRPTSELRVSVRPTSSRLPPRSPPRKTRPARQAVTTKAPSGPLSERAKEGEATKSVMATQPRKDPQPTRVEPINWVSSREEHGSDSDTADSNRTVLTDAGQAPIERPVVRRKRKGVLKSSRK